MKGDPADTRSRKVGGGRGGGAVRGERGMALRRPDNVNGHVVSERQVGNGARSM